MATAKVLQTPTIIEIIGSTIRVAHPNVRGNASTTLRSQSSAGASSLTVADNNGFSNGDYCIVGTPADAQTEAVNINSAVTRGGSIPVATTLAFAHELDSQVIRILERGIKIYGAASDGGSGTLIASIDAITTPIADAFMIQWDKPYTEYNLISTDTSYAYYFVKFTDGVTDSSASTYIPASGLLYNSVEPFIQQALDVTNSEIDDKLLTRDMLVRFANDGQHAIQQFKYQDPVNGLYKQKDWSFEVIRDSSALSVTQNENSYALSSLTYVMKYPNSEKGIINVQIGVQKPLKKISIDEMDDLMRGMPRNNVATQATAGAVTLVVSDTSDFADSGSLYVGDDIITYTAKTSTTFTGIPASGDGSITTTHAVGSPVWQNIQPGLPTKYTIFNGSIIFDRPIDGDYASQKIKIRYFYMLPRLTSVNSTTSVPFTNIFYPYVAWRICLRKSDKETAKLFYDDFNTQLLNNALADTIPTTDEQEYYNYADAPYTSRERDTLQDNYYWYP